MPEVSLGSKIGFKVKNANFEESSHQKSNQQKSKALNLLIFSSGIGWKQ